VKFHSPSTVLGAALALVAALFLTSCGGGGAAGNPDVSGVLTMQPSAGTVYAGIPFTFQVQGGRPPYTINSSEQTLLAVPSRIDGHSFTVVANNPGVARVAFGQLMQLLENNKLDTRLRELMIMRIGWVTGSVYEWTQHWRVATTAGIPPEDILAVRDWRNSDRLGAADKAILAATDECLAGGSITDASWEEVAKHVTNPGQQVEFVIAMGNWMMFSLLFRNLRIPLAEGVAIWPPDGQASRSAV